MKNLCSFKLTPIDHIEHFSRILLNLSNYDSPEYRFSYCNEFTIFFSI